MDSNVLDSLFDSTSSVSSTTSSSNVKESFQKRLLKRKRKPSQLPILDPDTVSLRSLEEFVGNVRKTNKRLSLPRLSSVSELLSPMRDRVLNIMCTQKSTMITQQQQDIKLRMSKKLSSPTSTTKKFRYSTWLETCDESLRQTMSEHEVERQNVIYELLSEEEKMVENLDLAQRVYRNGMKTLNILSDDELKQIFGPLEDILPLHEDLLYRLKPKYSTCVDAVGNIYLEWLQRIRSSYVSYCSNLINAKELLDQKRQNVRVEDYLKRCIDSGFSRKLDLWDFLGIIEQI
ncbi:unnamed protein product [Didymodactylos carnosus]|uniref:DH domain-containing protein n=1 Tax=Didymodactylos carnosus TaxID=1234261 RepID=A0A8S2HNU3_9BILA|nr:unnamed protein product [Didymodactylos carnosus]CAF3663906.1 unnamed protein product [Didymodactylos carnosus]